MLEELLDVCMIRITVLCMIYLNGFHSISEGIFTGCNLLSSVYI